jgi:hypothetical protein
MARALNTSRSDERQMGYARTRLKRGACVGGMKEHLWRAGLVRNDESIFFLGQEEFHSSFSA